MFICKPYIKIRERKAVQKVPFYQEYQTMTAIERRSGKNGSKEPQNVIVNN